MILLDNYWNYGYGNAANPVHYGASLEEYRAIINPQTTSFISIASWPIESNDYSLGYVILNDEEDYCPVITRKIV